MDCQKIESKEQLEKILDEVINSKYLTVQEKLYGFKELICRIVYGD